MIEGDDKEVERIVNRLFMLCRQSGIGIRVGRELMTRIIVDEKLVVTYKTKRRRG